MSTPFKDFNSSVIMNSRFDLMSFPVLSKQFRIDPPHDSFIVGSNFLILLYFYVYNLIRTSKPTVPGPNEWVVWFVPDWQHATCQCRLVHFNAFLMGAAFTRLPQPKEPWWEWEREKRVCVNHCNHGDLYTQHSTPKNNIPRSNTQTLHFGILLFSEGDEENKN